MTWIIDQFILLKHVHFIQLLQLLVFSFLLYFLNLLHLEKFLAKFFWYLDSLKMNPGFCIYAVQHFEALS